MPEYRINDLSEISGISVRNIRVYQDRGLLPPPKIRGRTGWYSDEHLVRLNIISRMLERGYTFATISELLLAAHYGMRVDDVLIGSPKVPRWRTLKRAATITINELRRTLNATDSSIALSQRLGLLAQEGAQYAIKNPELLEGAEVLVRAGIDLDTLLSRWARVQDDLSDVAASFVSIITDKYFSADGGLIELEESEIAKVAEVIQTVRPMAHEIVQSTFRSALDEQISRALAEAADIYDAEKEDRSAEALKDELVAGGFLATASSPRRSDGDDTAVDQQGSGRPEYSPDGDDGEREDRTVE
ncbi:MerR family transcriptional regulator [Williamsia sterculiae]|uniref:MerR HTH family regulatory protein n=1 Tax=Williamsia sterculiae TaxID=1344003 RepID=A0A1N7EXD6_9NOCA|nr:MerR family transcriptional regulator [Williamsia sterculiae]SIR92724.1 MerR HTH family regulatory protein [Williamsia sterculiae]